MKTTETGREAPQVTEQLRRFGENLVEQARLAMKYAAIVAVSTSLAGTADAESKPKSTLPSPRHSLFLVTDAANNPLGIQITPATDLSQFIDPTVKCGLCRIELRCPGGNIQAPVEVSITRMENGGVSVDPDAMRGAVGLAYCPGYNAPRPFTVPELVPLRETAQKPGAVPEIEAIPLVPLVREEPSAAPGTTDDLKLEEAPPAPAPAVAVSSSPAGSEGPAVEASAPAILPSKRFPLTPNAVEVGTSIPVISSGGLFSDPGFFARSVWQGEHLGGALAARWNPTRQTPGADGRFTPMSPDFSVRGNAFGLGAEGFVRMDAGGIPGVAEVEFKGGVGVEAFAVHAGRHADMARDGDGNLADMPAFTQVMPTAFGFGQLRFDFGQRVSLVAGGRAGVTLDPVQERLGVFDKSRLGFLEADAGAQIDLQ